MTEVQKIRGARRVPGGLRLYAYVNLYVCAQNPTLYKVHDGHKDLCILRVSAAVLDRPGVVVSDCNAAANARFAEGPGGLDFIDPRIVFASTWKHPGDPGLESRHKKGKCAEVLVPERVPGALVLGAYVSCEQSKAQLPGRPYLFKPHDEQLDLFTPGRRPWVLNFPTKRHWRARSRMEDIVEGLRYLEQHYAEWGIESLAVPPLGCGNGRLEWEEVGPILFRYFARFDIPVTVHVPEGIAAQPIDSAPHR